jgi:hypothetical protein
MRIVHVHHLHLGIAFDSDLRQIDYINLRGNGANYMRSMCMAFSYFIFVTIPSIM